MSRGGLHFTNRLKGEKSPYLQQHAFNPVDWYPWSEEALRRAKEEDKPIILSIGYSTCHWCHVMERESFEDHEVAKIMNENFVNIKVDREERPDLDSLYMKAVQAMTGHAGWPLTVFTTPEGVPFYGGSYFPPDDSYGLPSFKKVLIAVSLAYKKNKKQISAVTSDVEQVLKQRSVISPVELKADISDIAFDAARLFFDPVSGGFGRGTKFPHSMFLKFLLKFHKRTGQNEALEILKKTLSNMAAGGIYDHIGGGFHRYSVDERWDIPHFEKMLYDSALLSELYTLGFEKTGIEFYKDAALETLGYMLRDLRDGGGGFYSAQDADVKGEEGAYYLWDYGEIKSALGQDADKLIDYFSVTEEGNYEGRNMLRINPRRKGPEAPVSPEMGRLKAELLKIRQNRTPPDTDRKVITAWNGLAIIALCRAGEVFKRNDLIGEAKRCAEFLLSANRDDTGRVLRYYLGGKTDVKGTLEDYGLLGSALFSIFEAAGEGRWLDEAKRVTEGMIGLFYDESDNLFFDTGKDQEKLFVRERDLSDNDIPSGNSAAAGLLLKASRLADNRRYRELSEGIIRSVEGITDEPLSYGNFLCVLESFLSETAPAGRAH